MKKDKYMTFFLVSLVLFITFFTLGYQLMGHRLNKNDLADQNKTNNENRDISIVKEENTISPNTFIEKRVHFKECDHLITDLSNANEEIINMDRDEYEKYLKNNYPNLRLISFSNTKIVVWEERNHLCQEHYIIGEQDGYLAVFKIDEKGNRVLDNLFEDRPINLLLEQDRERIKQGIIVNDEEELSDVLENFIS